MSVLGYCSPKSQKYGSISSGQFEALTRASFFFQIAQVYDKMTFAKLVSLVPFATEHQLERAIVDGVKDGELQVSMITIV